MNVSLFEKKKIQNFDFNSSSANFFKKMFDLVNEISLKWDKKIDIFRSHDATFRLNLVKKLYL